MFLQTIKRRKLKWFGHISRHDNLCKTIMQGAVEGSRIRGRLKQKWIDNIVKWTKKDVNCLIKDVHELEKMCYSGVIDFPYDLRVTG